MTWKDVWLSTPGPQSSRDYFSLIGKGILMGSADIIPGVSGGTVAFIFNITTPLLEAISSLNRDFFTRLIKFQWREACAQVPLRFLFTLFLGVGLAILTTARFIHTLLENYPIPTWALFFGLIIGSLYHLIKQITHWFHSWWPLLLGILSGIFIVGLVPIHAPSTPLTLFFSGMIGFCAMVLPGISGAFILLILGQYQTITAAIKDPFHFDSLVLILSFSIGGAIGLISFSKFLNKLIHKYHNRTLAFLTGLIIGALRKIWPWKEVLEEKIIHGKHIILAEQNIIPQWNQTTMLAIAIMIVCPIVVISIERYSESA